MNSINKITHEGKRYMSQLDIDAQLKHFKCAHIYFVVSCHLTSPFGMALNFRMWNSCAHTDACMMCVCVCAIE